MRVRNFIFTYNNWREHENALLGLHYLPKRYIIYGKEEGLDGTPHLQGYVELEDQLSISTLNELTLKRLWISKANSQKAAIEYCKKQGNYYEYGNPKRSSLQRNQDIIAAAKAGKSIRHVIEDNPNLLFKTKLLRDLYDLYRRPGIIKRKVYWIAGPAGVGKSYTSYTYFTDLFGATDVYVNRSGIQNFYGYSGERAVILDDYRYAFDEFGVLLGLLDDLPMIVNMKGTNAWFVSEYVIITSPELPFKIHNPFEDMQQLFRRIDASIYAETREDISQFFAQHITVKN